MFLSIILSNLRHNEFIQFISNLTGIISKYDLEALKLKSQLDALTSLFTTISSVFKPDQGSDLTKTIAQDDERRDRAITGIQALTNAYTNHYDEETRVAALALSISLKKFGTSIAKQNYQGETATINAIIAEWKRETNLVASINKLSLNEWVEELNTANIQFDTHYLARIKEDAEAPDVKLIALRKEATQAYRALTSRIEAFATIGDEPTYAEIINECNSLIEKYNAVLNARSKKEDEEVSQED